MHAHLRAGDHQGITHVVAGVAHVYQFHALQMAQVLLYGKQGRLHLSGMIFIGQAVPDRYVGILRQFLYDLLAEATVLDTVEHTAQDTRSIRDALLLANLGA